MFHTLMPDLQASEYAKGIQVWDEWEIRIGDRYSDCAFLGKPSTFGESGAVFSTAFAHFGQDRFP